MTAPARTPSAAIPRLGRAEFCAELGARFAPGEHLSTVGPTGRGKSTLIGQLLPHVVHDDVVIMSPKGRDPAYGHLGHPTATWPPRHGFADSLKVLFAPVAAETQAQSGPRIWRVEVRIRKPADFLAQREVYRKVLAQILARPERPRRSLLVVVDDSRFVCDQFGLAKLLTMDLIIARSKLASMVNNFQAPRWVPREGLDQTTHTLLWRNRDRDVIKRLGEIAGDLDVDLVETTLRTLDYHEAVWIDGRADEMFIVAPD